MEIKVIKPFMAGGKPVEIDAVIDLPVADAAYVVGIGRAERIQADAKPAAEPAKPKKAKAS